MERTITVFKLPADGSLMVIPEEIPDRLEVLQQYVNGYIEIVTLCQEDDLSRTVMIVNTEGLIKELSINPLATALYQGYTDESTPICGNAIICSADAEGELQDIKPWTGLALLILSKDLRNRSNDEKPN